MTFGKFALAAILAPLLTLSLGAQSETIRDCTFTGTVKRSAASSENVRVDLHSVKPARKDADCHVRRNERLKFKLPASPELANAEPGTEVEYRYTEDSETGSSWKLKRVSR